MKKSKISILAVVIAVLGMSVYSGSVVKTKI